MVAPITQRKKEETNTEGKVIKSHVQQIVEGVDKADQSQEITAK